MSENNIYLSIVIPVYNEEENIVPQTEEIVQALKNFDKRYEIIFVDDGSTDNTLPLIEEMVKKYPDIVRFFSFKENRGQTAAFLAGFKEARGKLVATLDGDMQNDPNDLPKMIKHLEESGYDMVNGIRAKRRDNIIRKISSKIGNGFRNWMTKESVSDVGCSIRVMKRECVQDLPPFNGMHRFFPTLVRMKGYTITEIPVNHRERIRGTSKYGVLNRAFVGFNDVMAVRWMLKRYLQWEYKKTSEDVLKEDK